MKRLMLLSLVASLATLAVGTSASAQTLATRPLFATVACRGNTAACVKLDLYSKIADTGGGVGMAKPSAVSAASATSRGNSGAARMGKAAAGGTENNPAMDGGRAVLKTRSHSDRALKKGVGLERKQVVQQARPGHQSRARQVRGVARHGGDPTINNPDSSSRAPAQRARAVERVTSRTRLNASGNRAPDAVRSREITRHRPTDF